jgi:hypothetical protein
MRKLRITGLQLDRLAEWVVAVLRLIHSSGVSLTSRCSGRPAAAAELPR